MATDTDLQQSSDTCGMKNTTTPPLHACRAAYCAFVVSYTVRYR